MMLKIVTLIFVVGIQAVVSDGDQCIGCIKHNLPVSLSAVYDQYPSFTISAKYGNGYSGCGYVKDINDVYAKCANECQVCQKKEPSCEGVIPHSSVTVTCPPPQCRKRTEECYISAHCCGSLICSARKCMDCSPCGARVDPNKPSCGGAIERNGVWKCASGYRCENDDGCDSGVCDAKMKECTRLASSTY